MFTIKNSFAFIDKCDFDFWRCFLIDVRTFFDENLEN